MGRANMVVALEQIEALRALKHYGNPDIKGITNMRPVRFIGVISGGNGDGTCDGEGPGLGPDEVPDSSA